MPLSLLPAVPEDLKILVPIQYKAFHPIDSLHMLIYPSPHPPTPEVISRTIARTERIWMQSKSAEWVKVVDDETGEIIAAAKWCFWPEGDEKRWEGTVDPTWILPEEAGMNAGKEGGVEDKEYVKYVFNEEVMRRRREYVKGPGALLDICFCDPGHHRRGAGKMLVEWGTKRADEMGVKCFVESSKTGRRLYESCGFVLKEVVSFQGGRVKEKWKGYNPAEYNWMEREARPAAGSNS